MSIRSAVWVPSCLVSVLGAAFAFAADPPPPPPPAAADDAPATVAAPPASATTAKDNVDLNDIRTFTAVYSLVKQAYVDPVNDHRLMQQAIHGLLSGLDPHSEYLEKDALESLTEDTTGSYDGLGIEVVQTDGALRVIAPIDDTPAARGGIKPGDMILAIDGKPVQSDDLDAAVASLRGKPGSAITLRVRHEKQPAPVDIKLTRESIRVASVRGRLLEPGYAYFRISQFQSDTGAELRKRIERAQADNKGALKGAVLDLRSNPGGLLTSAVEVSDALLDSGVIVSTRGRLKESDLSFNATPGDLLAGAPLVVLVDNGTASAAEIVAGALKDNHRALLMGRRTFGKGSVQTVLPLDAEHAVKLTTARYYTPSGVSIQAAGIEPDITLDDLALSDRDDAGLSIGERDLPNHLKGADETGADKTPRPVVTAAPGATSVRVGGDKDYALNEALNALKALALRHRMPAAPTAPAGNKG